MHIIHEFPDDFYGIAIRVIVLGYVRPEQNYPSLGKYKSLDAFESFIDTLLLQMVLLEISEPMWKLRRNHFNALLMPNSSKMHCLYR